jgi:hypothetical protein
MGILIKLEEEYYAIELPKFFGFLPPMNCVCHDDRIMLYDLQRLAFRAPCSTFLTHHYSGAINMGKEQKTVKMEKKKPTKTPKEKKAAKKAKKEGKDQFSSAKPN